MQFFQEYSHLIGQNISFSPSNGYEYVIRKAVCRHFAMALIHLLAFWLWWRCVAVSKMRTSNSYSKTSTSMDIKSVVHLPSMRVYFWRTDIQYIYRTPFLSGFCEMQWIWFLFVVQLHLKYFTFIFFLFPLSGVQSVFVFFIL